MATLKKEDWIKDIEKLDDDNTGLLGEISREELPKFTIGQLKALHKDMVEELEAKNPPKSENNIPAVTDENGVFKSMCGAEFDPKKNGACHKECSQDFPDEFNKCLANFEKQEVGKPQVNKKPALGKTEWGHVRTKQGGMIDEFFLQGKVGSLDEISEFAKGKQHRCLHHMKHLVADVGIDIKYADKIVELPVVNEGDEAKKTVVRQYWWADKDKRRKGESLEGKAVPGWGKK